MQSFFKRLYWKIIFFFKGAPTAEHVKEKLARLIDLDNMTVAKTTGKPKDTNKCDCAVYSSAGNIISCEPNIFKWACDALQEPGIEVVPMPVGGCKNLPIKP